jgi:hypothetical protein
LQKRAGASAISSRFFRDRIVGAFGSEAEISGRLLDNTA